MLKYKFAAFIVFSLFISTSLFSETSWSTKGNQIINPKGSPVILRSVSWFGFETSNMVVHGIWSRNMGDMLDQMKSLGFNSIRLPYSNDILKPGAMPTSINFHANPTLKGKTALEVFDIFIQEASARQLYVILDRHRPTSASQSELWYTSDVPESLWIEDWVFLAQRYKDQPYVIGFDLHNEPHGSATWGNGDAKTDWKVAAEKAGNAILKVNPNALIIVEGISQGKSGDSYWWGGTLDKIREAPVTLMAPNKVVYSPHDYGFGVHEQPWFEELSFPNNMNQVWDDKWGYIARENIAPVWIGEFGGRKVDFESKEGLWQNKLVQYIGDNQLNFAYWSWNPNSGDTGGILKDDWTTLNQDKVDMLKHILE